MRSTRHTDKFTFFAWLLLVWMCIGSQGRAAPPGFRELLDRYRLSLDPLNQSTVELLEWTRKTDGGQRGDGRVVAGKCIRSGGRLFCESTRWMDVADPRQLDGARLLGQTKHWMFDGRMMALETRATRGDQAFKFWHEVSEVKISGLQGRFLCGYLPGQPDRIDRVLERARASVRRQSVLVGDVECTVVDAETGDARYTVWFAPGRSCCILKLTRVQEGKSLHGVWATTKQSLSTSERRVVKIVQTLDNVDLAKFGNHWIPCRADFTEEVFSDEGVLSVVVTTTDRKKIELDPDVSAVSFKPDVPSGTPVKFINGGSGLAHEWRDGKVLPRRDAETGERLRLLTAGVDFSSDAGRVSRFSVLWGPAMFVAGLLLLTAVLSVMRGIR